MNINEFQSTMNKYGGLARPNLYMVEILNANSQHISDVDLRMFCKVAAIPSMNLTTTAYRPLGIGPEHTMPTGMNHEPLSCVFMLDSNHAILSFFHNWFQKIINFDTTKGMQSSVDGMYPYEVNYRDDYCVDMRIKFYSAHDDQYFYEILLTDVYPTTVGSVSLSWEENDSIALLPVSFVYSDISFTSTISGSPTERFSRSQGVIQKISQLTTAQTINQSSLSSSVQSAIDKFTTVKNKFNVLKSILR